MRPSIPLELHRDAVLRTLSGYALENPRIFGSTARQEDVEGSDLDLLVDRGGLTSYSQIFELEDALAAILGVKVDIHTTAEFGHHSRARIAKDLKRL